MTPAETTKRWRKYQYLGVGRSVDTLKIHKHVDRLLSYGATYRSVADAAGVSHHAVFDAMNGSTSNANYITGQKILAVTTTDIYRLRNAHVRAIGTRRRIQALLTLGWTHAEMSSRVGVNTAKLSTASKKWVTTETRAAVVKMYAELCMTQGPSKAMRDRALKNGYRPPLDYVDEAAMDFETKIERGYVRGRRMRDNKH